MTLLELQRTMTASVMRQLTSDFGMQEKTVDGKPMQAHAATFIKSGKELSSFERLEIYNRQYWFRVLSNFADDFPGLCAALGEKRFDALAVAYLADNPSTSYTLRNLGSNLVGWLRDNPKWAGKRYDLVLDIARLEWAYVEAFDNAEHRPLTSTQFGYGWTSLNREDNQRIKPKSTNVTKIAEERHNRRGEHPAPRSPRFESEPQCHAAQRDADPEQVIDKAPQKNPVVEQQKGK